MELHNSFVNILGQQFTNIFTGIQNEFSVETNEMIRVLNGRVGIIDNGLIRTESSRMDESNVTEDDCDDSDEMVPMVLNVVKVRGVQYYMDMETGAMYLHVHPSKLMTIEDLCAVGYLVNGKVRFIV